eukprot:gene9276-1363_t
MPLLEDTGYDTQLDYYDTTDHTKKRTSTGKTNMSLNSLCGCIACLTPFTLLMCGIILLVRDKSAYIEGIRVAYLIIGTIGLFCFSFQLCCSCCMQCIQCLQICENFENDSQDSGIMSKFVCDFLASGCAIMLSLFNIVAPLMLLIGGILFYTPDYDIKGIGISSVVIACLTIVYPICACVTLCGCVTFGNCCRVMMSIGSHDDDFARNYVERDYTPAASEF